MESGLSTAFNILLVLRSGLHHHCSVSSQSGSACMVGLQEREKVFPRFSS
jgi:hypothetical protein